MRISPINSYIKSTKKACSENNYIPATGRHNLLSDIEFNIVEDKIKSQNLKNKLKNEMNVRLMNLKRTLNNNSVGQNFYQNG